MSNNISDAQSSVGKERRMREEEIVYKDGEPISTKNVIQLENVTEKQPMLATASTTTGALPIPDFTHISNMFNSYSTKKTFATGLLDLALIANNFSQMKQLVLSRRNAPWHVLDIVIMFSICASLILQLISGVLIIFSTKQEEFMDDAKRPSLVKQNNIVTLLVILICFINIFVNVFLNI